jgi:hypothetical protein
MLGLRDGFPVSQPGQPDEPEADAVAERVAIAAASPVPAGPAVHHAGRPGAWHAQARPSLGQLFGAPGAAAPGAAPGARERLPGRGSPGVGLPGEVAARLSAHVDSAAADAARLHTDDAADGVAAAHHAHAVTLGADIYFARGAYAPGTARGDELLVHELTHVAQGLRGELTRAAAKGITGGTNLDPAEAEADLRGKLAVVELHAPDGAAPPLAAPSGQPTSDGDRQAKLAAQQQRLGVATQPEQPLGDAQAPPASSAQAPAPHPPPAMKPAPQPAPTGNAYVDAFQAPPSKQAMELWGKAGAQATTQGAADQARFDAGLPPMPVQLDGGEAKAGKGGGPAGKAPARPPPAGTPPPAAQPTPTPPAPPVTAGAAAAQSFQPSADKAQMKADGQKVLDNLPTTAPDVKTDPGPAPVTDLAGQADPVRAIGDHQHAMSESAKAVDTAKQKVIAGPGAAAVQPVKLDEKLNVPSPQSAGAMPALPPVDGMAKLKQWNLPGNAMAAFDTVAKPKMDASLAQARAKMTEAEAKRDADRTKAVGDAQDKVKAAHADADQQQQAKVADARTQITNHQAETLVKHEAEVKKLDQQTGDRKTKAIGKVNDRISADQAKVATDYQGAQKKAEDKKQQGEADAKKKKEDAENKKKDEHWWDKAADDICDGIKAVAHEIDQALEAIGKAIGDILDAVKDAACKVIDAARDFVCQALTEFGDWLKSAVDALIGSVFPELAAALDRLIDAGVNAAKAAVNAIADGLKSAVSALCDALKSQLDAVISALRSAVQAAATLAQALVTGDWKLVAKMVLDGILKLLGIDPAAFYALIGKAEDSIEKIIQNPGAFVGHLIDAVKLGFKQFGANFWTHLKDGLVQWLFGTFASAGITMPASFDIAGIFDLVCQVLGLTWDRLRPKVVKVIGEKNTERLEFVAKYVQALVTGGFHGLWEQIKQDMSSLWDMVVSGVKDWIIEKVVQQAILKIATMWNPAGAIIQVIETAWNVYQWVRENAQRIFGLIQAVVDSVSNIVAGNIGGAANFIEASLAKLVPVAISLFADLIGLGGIADKIRGIIEKVQDKIDHAIDKLIARVMKLFKGKDKDPKHGGNKSDAKPDDRTPEEKKQALDEAVAALRPKVDSLLKKGTLQPQLEKQLAAWAEQYHLTSQTLEGKNIVAKVNPTENMYTAEERTLGELLEPILQTAQDRFLRQLRTQPATTRSAQRMTQARTALAAGDLLPQDLSPAEMNVLLHDAAAGSPTVSLPQNRAKNHVARVMETPGHPYELELRSKQRSTTPGATVPFTDLREILVKHPDFPFRGSRWGKINYQQDNLPGQPPTWWRAGINRWSAANPGSTHPAIEGLVDTVETARYPGNLAANDVARNIPDTLPLDAGADPRGPGTPMTQEEATYGLMAGMARFNAAYAAQTRLKTGARPTIEDEQNAEDTRRGSYAVIFQTLRNVLTQKGMVLVAANPRAAALVEVARAFESWINAMIAERFGESDLPAENAAAELEAKLTAFLSQQLESIGAGATP